MKIFPPRTKVKLYETGFPENDILKRRPFGAQLSDLVERISDPLVVAVNGDWGTGKTFFLKHWAGGHTTQNHGKAKVVYFDAFENDYFDDPLISITAEIANRFPPGSDQASYMQVAKSAVSRIALPAFRIAAAVGTAGLTEVTGPALDAAIRASEAEVMEAAEAAWKRAEGRKKNLEMFRSALSDLVCAEEADGTPTDRLVVIVDELDRCRPDYAIQLLEVIKHFFNIDGVHFVLGVNLIELKRSIATRYGLRDSAQSYLDKFINVTLRLPTEFGDRYRRTLTYEAYGDHCGGLMGLEDDLVQNLMSLISAVAQREVSLRDVDRSLTRAALLPRGPSGLSGLMKGWQDTVASLLVIRHFKSDLYPRLKNRSITFDEFADEFGIARIYEDMRAERSEGKRLLYYVWSTHLATRKEDIQDGFGKAFDTFGYDVGDKFLVEICDRYIESIQVPGET